MQPLEVSSAVRHIDGSLGVKRLTLRQIVNISLPHCSWALCHVTLDPLPFMCRTLELEFAVDELGNSLPHIFICLYYSVYVMLMTEVYPVRCLTNSQ
jgi:hypothetical protein